VRLSCILLSVVFTASAALAQNQPQAPPPQQNWIQQNWFPQEVENLGQNASSRTEFSLDHNMVVLASKVDQDDDSLRRVIAGVDGISVHRFKFQGPGMYDPQILNAVRQDYRAAGWHHLADAHQKYGYPQGTDLWLHFDHNTIRNIAFLVTRADQVALVSVSGSISPVDLLHLAGHFGIPRMEGGVAIPSPGAANAPPPPPDASEPPPSNNAPPPAEDYRHESPTPEVTSPTTPN
jgi:hypothetical protein